MSVPRLSIILPNYNHARFLPRCLDSSLGQSFGDFELIAIDDASTDNSYEILRDYARKDSRIRLYRNPKNRGVVSTLNRALSYCRGMYVHGAASDDYILPGYYEAAISMFRKHPQAAICLGMTRCEYEKGLGVELVPGDWTDERVYLSPEQLAPRMAGCGVPGPSLWRRDAFLKAGGYNPDLRWHCDWFTLQVIAFRHGLCFLPEVFTVVRMAENSYSNNQNRTAEVQRKVLHTLLSQLQLPENRDVVPFFERSGILRQFEFGLVQAAVTFPGPLDGLVELLKPHVLPHIANLMNSQVAAIRCGSARFLGACGAAGLAFDARLAEASRDHYPQVAAAATAARRSIQRSVPFHSRCKVKLRRMVGRILRRLDRYLRPRIHDQLERQEQVNFVLLQRHKELRLELLGQLIGMREQLDDVKQELAAARANRD